MNGWRVINSAKIVQDTSNPCKTGILVDNTVYPVGAGDWSQIENRPFYDDMKEVAYLDQYTFYMASTGQWKNLPFVDKSEIVVGKPLKVTYDGEVYECIVHDTTGMVGFGNGSMYSDKAEDTHEPFLILFNGPSIWVTVTEIGTHTISVVGHDYKIVPKKIDPKYIPEWNELENVPFSEKTVETSIEGMTIGDFSVSTSEAAHNLNVPLVLGQKWSIYKVWINDSNKVVESEEGTYEVQEDQYGRLFICGSPVRITPETIECNEQWVRMFKVQRIYIVGVSGTFTETIVNKLDPKYLPDAEKPMVIFGQDAEGNALVETDVEDLFTYLLTSAKDGLVPKCIYRGSHEVVPITSITYDDGAVLCYFAKYPALDFSAYMFGVLSTGEVGCSTV